MVYINIDPARTIDAVDPRIYSGFTEHMGRCIYGGLYDPDNPHGLSDPRTGFRLDVLEALRELKIPIVRYPGGNFVSSYRWQDGIGPRENRPRRPELAWLSEESNQFGTDEFIEWCRVLGTEPYICLNMGTGTLEDALGWLEYCNGSGNTYYANLRRKNGHDAPYGVKYWSLGNEVWGPWQVGQMESQDYAKKAFQWAKALRLLDPSIKLISCGETGYADWDRVTLRKLAPVVDYHSIHNYTVSQGKHVVNAMGPAAAEKGIEITRSLIDLAKIEGTLDKSITICYDEWNVWYVLRAPGEKGAEEHYDLSDAIAVASWLNVFVRKADIVKIACIAQSVNVISPIITSPAGLYKQTTYYPLHLFTNLMRGASLDVYVGAEAVDAQGLFYDGPTFPPFIQQLTSHTPDFMKLTKFIDVSAVLVTPNDEPGLKSTEVRVAIVNRHDVDDYEVPIRFGPNTSVDSSIIVHEVWSDSLKDSNSFEEEKVKTVRKEVNFDGTFIVKKHSFQGLGSIIFGYDLGVIAGVLPAPDFIATMGPRYHDPSLQGLIASIFVLGCFFGMFPVAYFADKFGRRITIQIGAAVYILGGALQTGAGNIDFMYAGRFFAGFGVGIMSDLAPLYQAEIAHPSIRGRLTTLQQFMLGIGAFIASWVTYGTSAGLKGTQAEWRIPLGLQIIPALPLIAFILLLPESPRWLADKGRIDEARATLARLHAHGDIHDPFVVSQMEDMKAELERARDIGESSWKELFVIPSNFRRLSLGYILQFSVQMTGVSAIQYYSTTMGFSSTRILLFQSINSIIALIGEACCVLWIDHTGRRRPLVIGNIASGLSFVVGSILMARWPGTVDKTWVFNFFFSACIEYGDYELFVMAVKLLHRTGFALITRQIWCLPSAATRRNYWTSSRGYGGSFFIITLQHAHSDTEMDALFEQAPLFVPRTSYANVIDHTAAERELRDGKFVPGELTEKVEKMSDIEENKGYQSHVEIMEKS
ncbi:hypothetical protein EYR40_008422 [Pleurotus pulmonarius]|nr:hypothetical protein EYR40_008422 [Pleurotus pulmonarius]